MKQQEEYDEMLRHEREKSSSWSGIYTDNYFNLRYADWMSINLGQVFVVWMCKD